MITYHLVDDFLHPSAGRKTIHSELEPGAVCRDFVPEEWDSDTVVSVVNGGAVELDSRLMEGDDLVLYMAPEWEIVAQIAISFAISYLMASMIKDPKQPDGQGPRTYGFDGLSNRWGMSTTIPVIFGSMRNGGHVIGYYTEALGTSGGNQVYMMLALSEGPVHQIAARTTDASAPVDPTAGGVFLDDNDAELYSGMQITVSKGTATGVFHSGFDGKFIQRTIGQEIGVRRSNLKADYTAGATTARLQDNSFFFATDTVYLAYTNNSMTGDEVTVASIDADGETLHLDAPAGAASHVRPEAVVSYSPITITGDGTTGTALRFNVHFPQGLYYMNNNGEAVDWRVFVQVRVRNAAGGAWQTLTGLSFINNRIGGYWDTAARDIPTNLQGVDIDIELQRMTVGPALLTAVHASQIILDSVVFNAPGIYVYPGTAILGINGVPTAQLNGRLPAVTAQVEGYAMQRPTNDAGTTFADTDSTGGSVDYRNPAWIVLEILRNNRFGLGGFVVDADIDFASFRAWGEYCEETVLSGFAQTRLVDVAAIGATGIRVPQGAAGSFSVGDEIVIGFDLSTAESRTLTSVNPGGVGNGVGVTPFEEDFDTLNFTGLGGALVAAHGYGEIAGVVEARCLCDFAFDEQYNIAEALTLCATSGRAVIVKTGDMYRAVIDKEREPVQLIDEANIIRDSFKRSVVGRVDLPNTMDAVFFDRDVSFNRSSARVINDAALAEGETQKIERAELRGVSRIGQAFRDAAYLLRKKRAENVRIEFEIGLDGLAAEAGDRIEVCHYSMTNGRGSKVIDAQIFSGVTQVKIDDVVDFGSFGAAVSWQIRIANLDDDTITTSTMNGGGPRGSWISLDANYGVAMIGSHCAYGPMGGVTESFVIEQIGRTEQFQRRVVAVRYDEMIFDETAPDVMPIDNGWEVEDNGEGVPIGEEPWDAWADNPGGTSVYGVDDSALAGLFTTGLHPDGTPWQKVALSWNAPSSRPPVGADIYEESFRTSGTYTASTRTFAGDGALSDYATEGGGRRWAGAMIRGYELFIRHPDGSADANGWKWIATTEQNGLLVDYGFERGVTYEFTVCPVMLNGWKLPLAKCPVISVAIPYGMTDDALRRIEPLPPTATYQNLPHLPPTMNVEFPAAEKATIQGKADRYEARIWGWIAGRPLSTTREGEVSLSHLSPDAAESLYLRTQTKADVWSGSAKIVETDYTGPNTMENAHTQLENVDTTWAGTKTDMSVNADGYLENDADLSMAYESGWIDGGLPGVSERRAVWITPTMQVGDGTLTGDATMTYEEVGQTYEGNLYEADPFIIRTFVAVSALGGADKPTWVECRGPIEGTQRYHAVKIEVTRATTDHNFILQEMRTEVWATSSTGGSPT